MFTTNREAMMGSYLFGWYFTMTIVLGMLGLLCLHHPVRGSWALPSTAPLLRLTHARTRV